MASVDSLSLEPPTLGATGSDKARTVDVPFAAVNLGRLCVLLIQLAALLAVVRVLNVGNRTFETGGFFTLTCCCALGFVIHYFTPFLWKQVVFVLISLIGGVLVLSPPLTETTLDWMRYLIDLRNAGAAVLLAAMLCAVFYACFHVPRLALRWRVLAVVMVGAVVAYGRAGERWLPDPRFWWLIGSLFMFRLIVYGLSFRTSGHSKRLIDFAAYCFHLPNFFFALYPVIDYVTFKRGYYADDIHRNAQRGIFWMARGVVHLCLDRVIYHRLVLGPDEVQSLGTMAQFIIAGYLLYLRVSGQFHISVGMLHLFGYKLPETNRKYFLADSFAEFWRRANIYWKDFMMNYFYYPAYLRLRKWNPRIALPGAILWVFGATMLFHSYQFFWLQGVFKITSRDLVFWTLLGGLVMVTAVRQSQPIRKPKRSPAAAWTVRVLSTVGVQLTIAVIWSMWSSESLSSWWGTVTGWI